MSHEHQSIRPSVADLSDVNFFEGLEVEANQLRNSQGSNPNALPSVPLRRQNPESSKPIIKKSRFAQQRQAELQIAKGPDDGLPVPTGRFELDLEPGKADDECHLSQTNESSSAVKTPLITEITERYGESSTTPNNFFDPKFCSDRPLETNPLKPVLLNNPQRPSDVSAHASIPPWELRRLARNNSSQKSPSDSSDKQQPISCATESPNSMTPPFSPTEKQKISSENESLMAQMSHDEILQEQAALKAHLMQSNPELLTKLLSKLNIKTLSNHTPRGTSPPNIHISKEEKHVHYTEEDNVIPCEPSPFEMAASQFGSNQEDQIKLAAQENTCPLRFDWNGVQVVGDVDTPADHSSDNSIHVHQASAFTFKQLRRLILSSVPAQRIMGFKILNQIIVRYIGNSASDVDDTKMTELTQQFRDSAFEILIVASQATRERNLGIATSALTLIDSIFSKGRLTETKNSKPQHLLQTAWIEHLLTQTTLLDNFHDQFQHQDLPRPSMTSIVRILRNMVALGDPIKVSEEIVKMRSFLELIVQVLIAVPWPVNDNRELRLPDLVALKLIIAIAKSSRTCSRSILDRGLLTPMLRFIGLPYWDLSRASDQVKSENSMQISDDQTMGVLINSIGLQFELMLVLGGYGLGTSLRTTLDPLLRSTTLGLFKILETSLSLTASYSSFVTIEQFNMISSYLKLLHRWMQCANDPHFSDPPHSITWSQVTEWGSSILDFIKLSSIPSPRPPGVEKVLASACALIAVYLGVSFKKKMNIDGCLVTLESLMPQLQSTFQEAARTLCECCGRDQKSKTGLSECHLLISLAKLKICLTRINTRTEKQVILKPGIFEYEFPNEVFALGCRMAFENEEQSLLPWALSILHLESQPTFKLEKVLLAGLFVRNSDGAVVTEIFSETFRECQARVEYECKTCKQASIVQEYIQPQLEQLLPIFVDYIHYAGTCTQISEPSPQQLKHQVSQNDKPAFLLPSTWPLLAITCLKPDHLSDSSSPISQIRSIDVARAGYALAIVLRSCLNEIPTQFSNVSSIFPRFLSDRHSVWKGVMSSVIAINSQAYWSFSQVAGDNIWSSIFEDPICSELIIRLIKISPLYPSNLKLDTQDYSQRLKVQESEEAELYAIFTDILAVYDSSSLQKNQSLLILLTPFLSMSRAREFRGVLFNDHPELLKHMLQISSEDVLNVDNNDYDGDSLSDVLEKYLYPVEENAQLLHRFAEFLSTNTHESIINIDSIKDSFLFRYLLHHVSMQCWNTGLEERIRIDLLKVILSRNHHTKLDSNHDKICHLVLNYEASFKSFERLFEDVQPKPKQQQNQHMTKQSRSQWLKKVFSVDEIKNDHHQVYLDRLTELGWITISSNSSLEQKLTTC